MTVFVLFLLLGVSLFVFFVTVGPVRGQGADQERDSSWVVKSYIWNRELNLWGRTNCGLRVGGSGSLQTDHSSCSNSDADRSLSHVRYYHDYDPADSTPGDTSDDVYGKLLGKAWSPLYGVINFDTKDFPSGDTSCYGLRGTDRQVRIKKEDDKVRLIGCVYVPFLRDYVLFNGAGAISTDEIPLPLGWDGVAVKVIEDHDSAYITLHGCGWSSKNSFWSFGPNKGEITTKDDCLPPRHNKRLASRPSTLGVDGNVLPSFSFINSSARIGQEVGYDYSCPDGYAKPTIIVDFGVGSVSKTLSSVLSFFSGLYREIFTKPVDGASLECRDRAGIFDFTRTVDSSGVYIQDSLVLQSFTVTPSVVTEGGFVSFGGSVSNQGNFAKNAAHCVIVDKITDDHVRSFDIGGLNVAVSGFDLVVRDAVYELQCRYRVFGEDGSEGWRSAPVADVSVRVLPSRIIERNVSENVGLPQFTPDGDDIQVAIPQNTPNSPGASEVYVYALDRSVRTMIDQNSLHSIFVDRDFVQADDGEDDSDIKTRLFDQFVRGRVVVVSDVNYGDIRGSSVSGKALVAEARTSGGQWSQKIVYTPYISGFCNEEVRNGCSPIQIEFDDDVVPDTDTHYRWRCLGKDGGHNSRTCWFVKSEQE